MRPLIGIPCRTLHTGPENIERQAANSADIRAVERAGGATVLIPVLLAYDSLASIFAHLDGLLLTGGVDVHPKEFGELVEPFCEDIDASRDETELQLTRWALGEDKPVFGICRGIQLLNVAAGGSLYQDISSQVGTELDHRHRAGEPFARRAHPIDVEPGSRLAQALGAGRVEVNSLHHQALKQLAPDLKIVAKAPDGVVEAVETTASRPVFVLGVQFHPEWLADEDPAMQRLFESFVKSAGDYHKAKAR